MFTLKDKHIVLGVSGGIAAYKSVELLRLLKKEGAHVRVVMTQNATQFVGPLTFEALSELPVCSGLFDKGTDAPIRHIDWASEADAAVIAPATANCVGKFANAIADDALSTFLLAMTAPVIVCPSMNTHMYENRAFQRNLDQLKEDGYFVLEPDAGQLACGTEGAGRLPDPAAIVDRLIYRLTPKDLTGKRIMVTAGPTREPLDPVRFISNPSSGKMGFSIARAAEHRGADVTLISGPSMLPDPPNMKVIRIETAHQMADSVFQHIKEIDAVIKTAAVSDYRPATTASQKMKKDKAEMTLVLRKNPDILKEIGQIKENRIHVGFAAETQHLKAYCEKKLAEKNLDMIVGNLVNRPESGFVTDTNEVTFFYRSGKQEALPIISKWELAHRILDRIVSQIAISAS